MASAQLPGPTLTAAERDSIVESFGGTEAFVEWLTAQIADHLEQAAARDAREAVNTAVREAIEAAQETLPEAIKAVRAEPVADIAAVTAIVAPDTPE